MSDLQLYKSDNFVGKIILVGRIIPNGSLALYREFVGVVIICWGHINILCPMYNS